MIVCQEKKIILSVNFLFRILPAIVEVKINLYKI